VALADMMASVGAGRVTEVAIDGTEYHFAMLGDPGFRHAHGPKADVALVRSLRPTDRDMPAPRVLFSR
jgi:hypothetical protein